MRNTSDIQRVNAPHKHKHCSSAGIIDVKDFVSLEKKDACFEKDGLEKVVKKVV